ncbi:MAG TPA: hypothetical protein VK636_03645 [Gemmatimonadaceae bacterium]|nr:hypothetical protein [Gemmatimonadaceae bacterium]
MDRAIFEDALVFVSLIVGMGCLTGIIITLLKRRGKQVVSPEVMGILRDMADRLQRLEGSVDTVAVEIERISEAQRFTTRLLAERAATPALPDKAKGVVTPH